MLGKYERLDVLGHGVSGIVYLAKDTLLNKQVALKEVDVQAGDLRRFLEEARVMDRLRHPNIVRVNGVDRIDGKIVIDMEYVRGQNLQELLRAEGCLPPDRALDVAAQILDALDYAHQMQTIHRDIKPANILISREGTVKLVDFGLAEILATNAYAGGAGTYAYMAPEDFAEEERSDNQSDIWAVGVTLYEMLTAQRPFQVERVKDPFAWKRALENEAPTPVTEYLPGAPPGLQAIFDRALARDKRVRYQTAGEFRANVIRLREGLPLASAALHRRNGKESSPQKGGGSSNPRSPTPNHSPRTGVGVVVADVANAAGEAALQRPAPAGRSAGKRARLPFRRRRADVANVAVEPTSVDFGTVRKGELRSKAVQMRVEGLTGGVEGSVGRKPDWVSVHPTAFDRARQTITLTAHSARTWETGEFSDTVSVMTGAGAVDVPVRMTVLKARPTFGRIALWYVPLFLSALLPALAVAIAGGGHALATGAAALVPSAAVATGMLALMLLLVCAAADVGMAERVACGVLTAVMCFVLGVAASHPGAALNEGMRRATLTGGVLGAALLLQLLYLSRWKFWGFALFCLGLLIGGTFLRFLTH
jgi:serine/threonine-protein kinase